MSIVFHYAPESSATRVYWALEELGVAYEKVRHYLRTPEMRDPAYLKVNPNGRVPALEIDGVAMFESLAIILHLGERFGVERGLWPAADSADRPTALTWAVWSAVTLAPTGFRYMMNSSERFPADARNAVQATTAKRDFEDGLRILGERLDGRAYLLGDTFTLTDVVGASALALFVRAKYDFEPHPRVMEWVRNCLARPAFQKVLAD